VSIPLREQHKNNGATTLNGGIDNSVTSLTVTTGSVLPSTGNFRIIIGSEVMICIARSTNTLTVIRGQEGTSAASHSDTDPVNMIYTNQGMTRLFQDHVGLFGSANVPPIGLLVADDGVTPLVASDFTWVNQDSASVTDRGGTILMTVPERAGVSVNAQERSAPSTPYTYRMAMRAGCISGATDSKPFFGVGFRESSSGKLVLIGVLLEKFFQEGPQVRITRYSSPTTGFTNVVAPAPLNIVDDVVWFKIENDGTNTIFYMSFDGIEWLTVLSESKTSYFAGDPDKVCWFGNNQANNGTGSTEMLIELAHWSKGE